MLQPAPGRRFSGDSPRPGWLIAGMMVLVAGAVAAVIGLLLQHAAAEQADTFHPATAEVIHSINHASMVGSIWACSGAIATLIGITLVAFALRRNR
ncbi:hypothetical protein Q7F20_01275 [Curtobacterium sp. A7_M15]|uniref:hypothetical protein n=1 Tax=Curtobacterium sp. A7_M15 TaxID=3065241 RepID=UPI002737D7DE|nr:hypothetical protein [Curtobacterium sp. A7_M15]MDP4331992.1 hypothetical protein [Curtobacterium sp. A7_M15]